MIKLIKPDIRIIYTGLIFNNKEPSNDKNRIIIVKVSIFNTLKNDIPTLAI